MKKKQYKVKYENGQIKPLEPIDLNSPEEGIVIFFQDLDKAINNLTPQTSKSLLSNSALEKIWNNEEDDAYNDL